MDDTLYTSIGTLLYSMAPQTAFLSVSLRLKLWTDDCLNNAEF